jgi:outer membrane protein OmpA-like peptidoglycan-associated protein
VLDEIADLLIRQQELRLDIEGYTSNDGIFNAKHELSNERAGNSEKLSY